MSSEWSDDFPHSNITQESSKASSSGLSDRINRLVSKVSDDSFQDWYRQREFSNNIREGKSFFNGPPQLTDAGRLTPSTLLQCKRKIYYQQLNAPREEPPPNGLFWVGSRFEDELALPYLEEAVANQDEYVTNSLWVDFDVDTPAGQVQIKGSTDPVIVDEDAVPIVPTEIKTKRSVHDLQTPNRHHLAQLHAYMRGLSQKYKKEISDGVLLYGSRTHLDVQAFHVNFDTAFWEDTVVKWAGNHAVYRLNERLPPADPEYDWECNVCDYRERCGKGSRLFDDIDATGLLPLFVYPRRSVTQYLETYGGKLTPSLAHQYPDLTEKCDVHDWWCRGCESHFTWDAIDWQGDVSNPPKCQNCMENGDMRFLSGPDPENQIVEDNT